ncbi:MAG: type II secretion system F family protein [Longimicrobiales bacterium]
MPVYRYIAFDPEGNRHRGLLEADDAHEVRARLKARELFASEVTAGGRAEAAGWRRAVGRLLRRDRSREMAMPLRELATMLSAGISLVAGLEALAEQSENRRVERVFRALKAGVSRGESLSEAAGAHPEYFGPAACNMLGAGETTGRLDRALRRLSDDLVRRGRLTGRVAAALLYPAVLAAVSTAVVAFLLAYVVPRIAAIYTETGVELPRPTRVLLALSGFFSSHGTALAGVLVLLVVAFRLGLTDERFALRWDGLKLRLPFVGVLLRKKCVADFCSTLRGLIEAGVPLVRALRVTGGTLSNRLVASEVREAADEVERGHDASTAIRHKRVFPATVAEMMAAGEESGELSELLAAVSEDYEHQVETAAERACRALEPLVVVLMGGVVLFIVLAVLLPIVRVNEVVSL